LRRGSAFVAVPNTKVSNLAEFGSRLKGVLATSLSLISNQKTPVKRQSKKTVQTSRAYRECLKVCETLAKKLKAEKRAA